MDLSTIYTIIFIGVILIGGIIGVALGGLKMITRLIGTVVCFVLAFLIASNLCIPIYNNLIKEGVHEAVGNALVSVADKVEGITVEAVPEGVVGHVEGIVGDLKDNVGDVLNNFNFEFNLEELNVKDLLKNMQAETDNDIVKSALGILTDNINGINDIVDKAKKSDKGLDNFICEDIVDPIGIEVTKVIIFLILVILLKVILVFITSLIDGLFKDTVVGGFNRLVGMGLGLVCGIAIAYVIAVGIGLLSDMQIRTDLFNRRYVEESVVGSILINFDIAKVQEVIFNTEVQESTN